MKNTTPKIIYTKIDEAPALATYSLLPIIKSFTKSSGIEIETKDISLSGRIIATFSENLTENQKQTDDLAYLGELAKTPEANIIKLPNISASIPQLKAAIKELKNQGYNIPEYPEDPKTEEEKNIQNRYSKILGSAVNPVLREGNSDRRVAVSVKQHAMKNPHKMMRPFSPESKSHVAHMTDGDFFGNEKSVCIEKDTIVKMEFIAENGEVKTLKDDLKLQKNEFLDATFMSVKKLRSFIEEQIIDSQKTDTLFSAHLKATMMKVSDPVMFGHFVSVFYKDVFEKHATTFKEIGVNPNLGLSDLYLKIEKLPEAKKIEISVDIKTQYSKRPKVAMVDSDKGITNFHTSSDIIIDASMPVVIRDGGQMWNAEGKLQDTKAIIPDRCYATIYKQAIEFCKKNGAFNPSTMGNVANVGLMAQKAEEYGSHDKTFLAPDNGEIRIVDADGKILTSHKVEKDDIWRACQTKDLPIQDWVKLAVRRAKATGAPAIFWLNENRAHDAQLIKKVNEYLKNHDTKGLEISIMTPDDAINFSMQRAKEGKDTISVTGNVLRDYLTDLFPILELGTSAKMLSIVPLLAGGGLFETGAGGSAPKHVQQFLDEGHLRWDSLGEFLALTVSLEHLADTFGNEKAKVLSETLDIAVGFHLENDKAPSRKAGELDNRGSHFYLALYWAEALANQNKDQEFKNIFSQVAKKLKENEQIILKEIAAAEGKKMNIGGYYHPDDSKAFLAFRPSKTFNEIIDSL